MKMSGTPSERGRDTMSALAMRPGHHHNMTGTPSQCDRDTITTWPGHHHNTGTPSQHRDTITTPSQRDRDTIATPSQRDQDTITKSRTPSQSDRDTITTWPGHHHNVTGTPSAHQIWRWPDRGWPDRARPHGYGEKIFWQETPNSVCVWVYTYEKRR